VHSSCTASSSLKDSSASEISSIKSRKDFFIGDPVTDHTH
jgi:hypothetical protein